MVRAGLACRCDGVSQARTGGPDRSSAGYMTRMGKLPRGPRPWWAVLVLAVAGLAGCITAFAPDIRREAHHGMLSAKASGAACLKCHEVESAMARRMNGMSPQQMADHMRPDGVIRPPLVADWMVKDRRGCVGCHALKEPRA